MTQPEVWRIGGDIVALELGGPWPALSSGSDEGLFSFLFYFSGCICVKGLVDSSMCAISIIISAADDVIETLLSVSDDSLHVSLFGVLLLLVFSLASSLEKSDRFRSLARIVLWLEISVIVSPGWDVSMASVDLTTMSLLLSNTWRLGSGTGVVGGPTL